MNVSSIFVCVYYVFWVVINEVGQKATMLLKYSVAIFIF